MASTQTDIFNLALHHLGASKAVATADERSAEAAALRRLWTPALENTLRDFPWPFATRFAQMGLVASDPAEVDGEWAYSYRYPPDCLQMRRLLSGSRTDTQASSAKFRIASDATGLLVYADLEEARAEYTAVQTVTAVFPPDFVSALSYRLAADAAPSITGGDAFRLGERALQFYQWTLAVAQSNATNESQRDAEPDNEFIKAYQ